LRAVEADARPRLAAHHGALDGASNASEAGSVVDWLERVHHLGSAGPGTDREWLALDLRCREFFWDRGRALSRQGHYDAAARVYRDCIRRFGADDADPDAELRYAPRSVRSSRLKRGSHGTLVVCLAALMG
jgi:hypothetical protein